MCSVSKSVTQHVFSSYVFLCFMFCKMWQKYSPSSLQRITQVSSMIEKKMPIILTLISVFITTFMWIRNGNWQHLLIVILGKHQILNAYKYYLIPVLILMSIKLLSSHFASYMLWIAPHFVFGRPSLKVYEKQFCRDARKHFTIHMGSQYLGICWNLHHHFQTIQPEHRT